MRDYSQVLVFNAAELLQTDEVDRQRRVYVLVLHWLLLLAFWLLWGLF